MVELKTDSTLVPRARVEGDAVIASVSGEIDLHNSPELRRVMLEVLLASGAKKVILNLQQVSYMDSSAVAVLVESLQKLRRSAGKLCLTNLQPRVKGLLEIARLDSIFIVAADEQDAMTK